MTLRLRSQVYRGPPSKVPRTLFECSRWRRNPSGHDGSATYWCRVLITQRVPAFSFLYRSSCELLTPSLLPRAGFPPTRREHPVDNTTAYQHPRPLRGAYETYRRQDVHTQIYVPSRVVGGVQEYAWIELVDPPTGDTELQLSADDV